MKKRKLIGGLGAAGIAVAVALFLAGGAATAGAVREVVLEDGSVIRAEVLALRNGVYTLRSETMGEIDVNEDAIRAIRSPSAAGATVSGRTRSPVSSPGDGNAAAMRESILGSVMSNPNLLGMIFALRDDPEVQGVLRDADVMEMVMAGDLEGLKNDPKFRRLMENPGVRSLTGELVE